MSGLGAPTGATTLAPIIFVDKTGKLEVFVENISVAVAAGVKGILILAGGESDYSSNAIDDVLCQLPIPVCGGIFPRVIYGGEHFSRGSIVCGFYQEMACCQISGLSDDDQEYTPQMQEFADAIPFDSSLLVFVDGISSRVAYFLEECFGVLGSYHAYLGGGAGPLGFESRPCIFTNQGLQQHCAQVASLAQPMKTYVEHGWQKLSGPHLVTGASNNIIHSLDYRPAFEVYRESVRERTGETITQANYFEMSKRYPFGLSRIDGQIVVRVSLKVDGGSLVCVGEVPANQLIFILHGDVTSLIGASTSAAILASATKNILAQSPAIVFDCIGRFLHLDEQFSSELEGIMAALPSSIVTIGALSLGEIACCGDTCLEFFNKTVALGVFYEI